MIELLVTLAYVVVTALIGVLTAAVIYARWHYGTLEGIKGLPVVVKPAVVGGSDVFVYKKIVHDQDTENVKKYGKIYGYYEGRQPQIYISDADMIRSIFIKDFDHFHNKRIMDFGHELINEMMDVLPYDKWKVVRTFISPTLTTGKIRNMSISMTEAIEDWMDAVKTQQQNNTQFSAKKLYTALTTDVIARCGFGTRLNSLHDADNIFIKHLRNLVSEDFEVNCMITVSHVFPFLARLQPIFLPETLLFFRDLIKNVMETRRKNNVKVNDFVDTLNEMTEKLQTEEYKRIGITETTIMCQGLIFFLAGFETTASTMTYLTYLLSKNPDVQEKLVAEVDAYLARHDGKIGHETINELVYMHACVQETLRMFPPLIRLERVCNKPWRHDATGLSIPEGMVVQVPVFSIHYNPEYFPDPYSFKPERFLPENKEQMNPYAFLSFGQGNHNCVGMRFAKEELYLAMANVLKNFTFKENADTKIRFRPGRTFLISAEPFTVDAIRRNN